jgi:hypothetical protein
LIDYNDSNDSNDSNDYNDSNGNCAISNSNPSIAGQLEKKPLRWTFRGWVCCILRCNDLHVNSTYSKHLMKYFQVSLTQRMKARHLSKVSWFIDVY